MTNNSNLAKQSAAVAVSVSACPTCGATLVELSAPCPACAKADEDRARIQEALLPFLGSRYELKGHLGSGAFGDVYRAYDTMLARDVAIKRVRLDAFADSEQREEMRQRSVREARTAAKIKHPNIVTIHDIVDTPESSFILMEFIDGFTLESLLKKKRRLTLDETLGVLEPTAQALDCAHEHGVVHRDVKPANIMLEGSNGVKVTDFGIAKSDAGTCLTAAGSILGTPNYMSPEQARGDANVDGRSDLFALGCVLFECLAGQKAFRGENLMATLMAIINKEPAAVDFEALGVHSDIGPLFERALAKEASKRYPSAMELMDAVRSLPRIEPRPVDTDEGSGDLPPALVVTRRELGSTSSFDVRLQGSLTDTNAAELIREVYSTRNTGILHVSQNVGKRIYFKKGNIVFANSDLDSDRLGEFLIANEQLDRATFDLASKTMKQTGQRFGRVLTEFGVLSEEGMEDAVRRQIEAIICSIIALDSGAYGFEFLERPVEEDIALNLSTAELILGGVRKISVERVRKLVGNLDRVILPSDNPLLLYQKMTLTTSEGFVLSRVDGSATVSDIAAISPLGDEETLRCLFALIAAGIVELGRKPRPKNAHGSPRQDPKVAALIAELPKQELLKPICESVGEPQIGDERAHILEDIAAKHASLETADHYQLLAVERGASNDEIKHAYHAMAKKYHPDRHHHPALKQVHGLLEELFGKTTDAYKTLSNPARRRKYDGQLHVGGQPQKTPRVEAKAPEPEQVTIAPEVIAGRQYQQGKKHFGQMEYFDAIQCLRESVRLSPETTAYRKLLAECLTHNPKWRKEAESLLLEVLNADEFDIECRLRLAEMYEASNLPSRAMKEYETILAYDPGNSLAQSKLLKDGEPAKSKLERLKNVFSGAKG